MSNNNVPISYLFYEINKLFIDNVRNDVEKLGINPTYRFIFQCLNENKDGLSQVDICKHVHLKAPSISLTLQQMENDGLIVREKSSNDSRQTIVKLTEDGIKLDNKLKQIFKKHENKIISALNKQETNDLLNSIYKIKDSLKGE